MIIKPPTFPFPKATTRHDMLLKFSLKKEYLVKRKKELTQSISILVKKKYFPNTPDNFRWTFVVGQWRVDFNCFSPSWVSWLCLNGDVLKKNYNFYISKDMKYTCIIIRYNLRVRNFLTKGLGTRTYSTFQRERKSETIMLISNCAELLALFLKKINNLLLQCKKLLPGLSAKSTTGRTAEMNVDFYVICHWPSTPFRKNI